MDMEVGWELKEERAVQKFKTVGYYKTKQEALDALADYNKSPYDLDTRAMTFEDVYRIWLEKSMYNLMFDYALEHEIVDKNYARIFNLDEDIIAQKAKDKKPTIPFNNEELKLMWDNVDKILIGIYSGWRPQEMAILKLKDIDLDKNIMFGGSFHIF